MVTSGLGCGAIIVSQQARMSVSNQPLARWRGGPHVCVQPADAREG